MSVDRSHPFFGAYLKIRRAKMLLSEFESMRQAYINSNTQHLRDCCDLDKINQIRRFGHGMPEHTPAVVGDVIHNLKTALDYSYCALVKKNGQLTNKTFFPFDQESKVGVGKIKAAQRDGVGPGQKAVDYIVGTVKPFGDAQSELYALNRLDIADKHYVLISASSKVESGTIIYVDESGKPLGGGLQGFDMIMPNDPGVWAFGCDIGLCLSIPSGREPKFEIEFTGDFFRDEATHVVLRRLLALTQSTVDGLKDCL